MAKKGEVFCYRLYLYKPRMNAIAYNRDWDTELDSTL